MLHFLLTIFCFNLVSAATDAVAEAKEKADSIDPGPKAVDPITPELNEGQPKKDGDDEHKREQHLKHPGKTEEPKNKDASEGSESIFDKDEHLLEDVEEDLGFKPSNSSDRDGSDSGVEKHGSTNAPHEHGSTNTSNEHGSEHIDTNHGAHDHYEHTDATHGTHDHHEHTDANHGAHDHHEHAPNPAH